MKNNAFFLTCLIFISIQFSSAQSWSDTIFQFDTYSNITYGVSTDFQGGSDTLKMDISVPINNNSPLCGNPLLVVVHGGAWYVGDRKSGYSSDLRTDFAKRGYVTASIDYRLGMFNTNRNVDCILEGWKCWNMADTSEWYRANYRAIQDLYGAVRFLVNSSDEYNINPDNIFIVGESAGGFIALGAGYIDDSSEIFVNLVQSLPDAERPNSIYNEDCIINSGIATDPSEMNLSRPSLGQIKGQLNQPAEVNYKIRGIGSFYGGAFNNYFENKSGESPALYIYHQPCDLIVPYNYSKLLSGFNNCARGFPTFCQNIINRPLIHGSFGIKNMIDTLSRENIPTCDYFFDNTKNTYTCFQQLSDPTLACHSIDDYWLRTSNMAEFFAGYIVECMPNDIYDQVDKNMVKAYPNPFHNEINIWFKESIRNAIIEINNVNGELIHKGIYNGNGVYSVNISNSKNGVFYVKIFHEKKEIVLKLVKI